MLTSASFDATNAIGVCGSCDLRWSWPGDNTGTDGHYISFNGQKMAIGITNNLRSAMITLTGTCFIPFSSINNFVFWNNDAFNYQTKIYGYNGINSEDYNLYSVSTYSVGSGSSVCPAGKFTFNHSSISVHI